MAAASLALVGALVWSTEAVAVPIGEADRAQVVSTAEPVGDVAFGDALHGWRVGAGGLILATTDGGATWTRQVSPTAASLTAVDAVSATRAWALGPAGLLLRTTDGGTTWNQIQLDSGHDAKDIDFVDANHGWIVEWYGAIRATSDGGVTWTAQTTGNGKPFAAVTFLDANRGFVGGGIDNDRFVWGTDDGGRSWQVVLGDFAPSSSIRAIDFSDALHGIAVGTNGFSSRTANGGATWTETYTGLSVDFTGVVTVDATHALAVGIYRYAQSTPVKRIYATSDAGATWTAVPDAPLGDIAAIAQRPGGGFVAAAPGATTFTSSDGANWVAAVDEARSPNTLRGLATSGSHLVAVGDDGAVRASHDGGVTWADRSVEPAVDLTGVAAVGSEFWAVGSVPDGLGSAEQPVVLHSSDHGDTWTQIGTGLPALRRINAVTFTDATHGWVAGSGPGGFGAGFVAATTDGGATWSVQTQTSSFPLTSIEVIGSTIWAMGTNAFARSTDGGATWAVSTSESDPAIPAPALGGFDLIDAQHGWIGAYGKVLQTADGGATWQTLANPGGVSISQIRFADSLHGWALDGNSRVLETTDGGTSWTPSWVPHALTSVTLDTAGRAWLTGAGTVAVGPSRRQATVTLTTSAANGSTRNVTADVAALDLGSTVPTPPVPTGSVRFTQGTSIVATVPLAATGSGSATATATVSAAPQAAPVVASYLGDTAFGPAPSPAVAVAARPAGYPYPSAAAFVDAVNARLRGGALTPAQRAADASRITTSSAASAYVANRLAGAYCTGSVGPVYRLYAGFFTRPPDTPGLSYWVGRVRGGARLSSAAASFAASSEFRRIYGTVTDAAYVDLVYRNVLGRTADASGRAYWIKRLQAGASRGTVMTAVSESSENVRKAAGAVTVESLAFCLTGRAATGVELTGGSNALGHGVPASVLVRELLGTGQIRPPAPA